MMSQSLSFRKSKTFLFIQDLLIKNCINDKSKLSNYKFSEENIDNIHICLVSDMNDTIYKMLFSFFSALIDMKMKNFSWATIKFYYSIFYYMKSKLLCDGIHITYLFGNYYAFDVNKKNKFIKFQKKQNSHTSVFEYYNEKYYQRDILLRVELQDDGNDKIYNLYQWYQIKREIVNYKSISFEEPSVYEFWESVINYVPIENLFNNIIKSPFNYINTDDYAIISVPICCFIDLISNLDDNYAMPNDKYDNLKNIIEHNDYCRLFSRYLKDLII